MTSNAHRTPCVDVRSTLAETLLVDGFPLTFDLDASQGSWVVDARNGDRYLDLFSFFASLPLGFNHPRLRRPDVEEKLLRAAIHKPSNSDAYSTTLADFVRTFAELARGPDFRYLFFIEGGALAVENALKTAFDWKVRRNLAAGREPKGSRVLHLQQAFHGRSGYTLSLTNTDPIKTEYFPRFDWPRMPNPKLRFPVDREETARVAKAEKEALAVAEEALSRTPHDVAAIIIEPIQGEGGDNHFRAEFLAALRALADRAEALLIFDEVQTGLGLTGKRWAYEHFDVVPDVLCFGKKTQVCGIMVGERIDEVPDHVFKLPSRINSTWGGGLVDMVRCQAILEAISEEGLIEQAARTGAFLLEGLTDVGESHPELATNVRGRGLMCAFDLPSRAHVKPFLRAAMEEKVLLLPCGERSIRFRPALTVTEDDLREGLERLDRVLGKVGKSSESQPASMNGDRKGEGTADFAH